MFDGDQNDDESRIYTLVHLDLSATDEKATTLTESGISMTLVTSPIVPDETRAIDAKMFRNYNDVIVHCLSPNETVLTMIAV